MLLFNSAISGARQFYLASHFIDNSNLWKCRFEFFFCPPTVTTLSVNR